MTIEMKPKKQKKNLGGPDDSEPKKKKVKFAAKPDVDQSEGMDHSGIENKVIKDSSIVKKKKKSLANKIVDKKNTLKAKIQNGGHQKEDSNVVNDAEKKAELKEKKKKLKEERRKKEKEDGVRRKLSFCQIFLKNYIFF